MLVDKVFKLNRCYVFYVTYVALLIRINPDMISFGMHKRSYPLEG
jgi:hypothetical protein